MTTHSPDTTTADQALRDATIQTLPAGPLRDLAERCQALALIEGLPTGIPPLAIGLRHLLEATDCVIRAAITTQPDACSEPSVHPLDRPTPGEPTGHVVVRTATESIVREQLVNVTRERDDVTGRALANARERDLAYSELQRLRVERAGWQPLNEALTRSLDVERATVARLRVLLGEALDGWDRERTARLSAQGIRRAGDGPAARSTAIRGEAGPA